MRAIPGEVEGIGEGAASYGAAIVPTGIPADDFFAPGARITIEARGGDAPSERSSLAGAARRNSLRCLVPAALASAYLLAGAIVTPSSAHAAPTASIAAAPTNTQSSAQLASGLPSGLKQTMDASLASWAKSSLGAIKSSSAPFPQAEYMPASKGKASTCHVSMNGVDAQYQLLFDAAPASEIESGLQRFKMFREHVALHEAAHCEMGVGLEMGAGPWREISAWVGTMSAGTDRQQAQLTAFIQTIIGERYADTRALLEAARLGADLPRRAALVLEMRSREAEMLARTGQINDHDTADVVRVLLRWAGDPSLTPASSLSREQAARISAQIAVASIASDLPRLTAEFAVKWAAERQKDSFAAKSALTSIPPESQKSGFQQMQDDTERMIKNASSALGDSSRAWQASWERGEIPEVRPVRLAASHSPDLGMRLTSLISRLQATARPQADEPETERSQERQR